MRSITCILLFFLIWFQYPLWFAKNNFFDVQSLKKRVHLESQKNLQLKDHNVELRSNIKKFQYK